MDRHSDEEPFLPHDGHEKCSRTPEHEQSLWRTLVLATSLLLNAFVLYSVLKTSSSASWDQVCASHVEQESSPLLEEVDIRYNAVDFNGSFFEETIYRQRPSPEVDAAWDALGVNLQGFPVPEKDGPRFGLDTRMAKRLQRQGGGYVALSEGMHHLHCVNLLRQSSYFNYQYYRDLGEGPFVNNDSVLEKHLSHCVDILRQQLMCSFDTGIFGQWWVKDLGPFVDFNTKHRCKNFADLARWVREHQLVTEGEDRDLVGFRDGDVRLDSIP